MGIKHPGLFRKNLKIKANNVHWLRKDKSLNINEESTSDEDIVSDKVDNISESEETE